MYTFIVNNFRLRFQLWPVHSPPNVFIIEPYIQLDRSGTIRKDNLTGMEQNLIIQLLDGVEGNKIDNVRISGKELKKAGLPESTCSNLLKKLFEAMKNNSSVKKIRLNGTTITRNS